MSPKVKHSPEPLPVNQVEIEARKPEATSKRKNEFTYEDFKRDCKRLRPEFGKDEEEEFDLNITQAGISSNNSKEKIIFFSVFNKSNAKMNHEIMFRKKFYRKPKLSSARRVATSAQGQKSDIRKFFHTNSKCQIKELKLDQLEGKVSPTTSIRRADDDVSVSPPVIALHI